ncbi:MAG: OsmC family protein [Hyphomicrobiales bacterium]|nr:OsmC family protein [Hyphomicrobiales bacterium]
MTRAQEFGPETLVAAGLGSCMLISMAGFAERHRLDVTGARADVDATLGGEPEMRITAIDVMVRVPKNFNQQEQTSLEKAAATCPIKHSFGADTKITTRFEFGNASVKAA